MMTTGINNTHQPILEISYASKKDDFFYTQISQKPKQLEHISIALEPHEKIVLQRSMRDLKTELRLENLDPLPSDISLLIQSSGDIYLKKPQSQLEPSLLSKDQSQTLDTALNDDRQFIHLATSQAHSTTHFKLNTHFDQSIMPTTYKQTSLRHCTQGSVGLLSAISKFATSTGQCTLTAGATSANLLHCATGLATLAKGLGAGPLMSGLNGLTSNASVAQGQLLTLGVSSFEIGLSLSQLLYGVGEFTLGFSKEVLQNFSKNQQGVSIDVTTQKLDILSKKESEPVYITIQPSLLDDYVVVSSKLTKPD